MDIGVRIVLAGVLLWAAGAKLRDPRGMARALAEQGVPAGLRRPAAVAVIGAEAALGALLIPGGTARAAGAGTAVLGLLFAVALVRLRLSGRTRAACGCFGAARERPVALLAARAALLAAAGAAVATGAVDRPAPSGGVLTAAALGGLALAVLVLAVLVLALYRQVGVLEARLGPRAALELAEEGPPVGQRAPALGGLALRGPELVAFASPGCRLCEEIEPALRALAHRGVPVTAVREDDHPEAFRRYRVPGTPFVAYLVDGVVRAKGLVNTLEQIEELIALGDRREGHVAAA